MAFVDREQKELSEHEVLLSDAANDALDDAPGDFGQLDAAHGGKHEHGNDPLVAAAMNEHAKKASAAVAVVAGGDDALDAAAVSDDDLPSALLDKNAFRIPTHENEIKCGISWTFLDDKHVIDLDVVVTALDVHSFEMGSVNKDHKKLFKKSLVYNKNKKNRKNKDDKCIQLKLDAIPTQCNSLWFRINAYSGDSLKNVDKATFNIYGHCDDGSCSSDDADEEVIGDDVVTGHTPMDMDRAGATMDSLSEQALNLRAWLEDDVVLPEYFHVLVSNGYDSMDNLKLIESEHDLEAIGIVKKGHQKRLLQEIQRLDQEGN
mmetsp:Transcript_34648/g.56475  ORF Transcript_34648/g.56475 Transcript_34648/m.56475 type:complete len:318 (+) Transcript_34648:43-996(+)